MNFFFLHIEQQIERKCRIVILTPKDMAVVSELVLPTATRLLEMDGRDGFYAVVYCGDKTSRFECVEVIFNLSKGDIKNCDQIAKAKAAPSWRTGVSSREVSQHRSGFENISQDAVWPGAVAWTIGDTRVVASVSGLTGNHDEYLALLILITMDAVGRDVVDQLAEENGIVP